MQLFWVHLRLDDPLGPKDLYVPPGDYPSEEAEEEEEEAEDLLNCL